MIVKSMPEAEALVELEHHEVSLWSRVYTCFIKQGYGIPWSSKSADKAVLELRKRYDPNKKQGPYR